MKMVVTRKKFNEMTYNESSAIFIKQLHGCKNKKLQFIPKYIDVIRFTDSIW